MLGNKADGTHCGTGQVCASGSCVGDPTVTFPSPLIDAAALGAVCDGVHDDTAALRSALTRVASGGTVVLPAGKTCLISATLEASGSGFAIDGAGATIRMAKNATASFNPTFRFWNASSYTVADLTIDGNRQNRTPVENVGHNVYIGGGSSWTFYRVQSLNATEDGFYVAPTDYADSRTYPRDGVFRECVSDNSYRNGMSIINGFDIQVLDSSFSHTNGTLPEAGLDIEPNTTDVTPGAANILIRGSRFEWNNGYGMEMSGAAATERVTIEQSVFTANGGALAIASAYSLVRDNVFQQHTSWGALNIRGGALAHDIVVADNTFTDNPGDPNYGMANIFVGPGTGTDLFILGNVFIRSGNRGITNNNTVGGVCAAGNVVNGVQDAPPSACPAPPVVGSGT